MTVSDKRFFFKTTVSDPENILGVGWVVCGGGNNNVIEGYQGPLKERCGRKYFI